MSSRVSEYMSRKLAYSCGIWAGSAGVRGQCHACRPTTSLKGRARMNIVSLLLLIVGVLAGAAGAVALLRPNRERMRDELKAISLDVLQRTGDSLAQRVDDARRAEEER